MTYANSQKGLTLIELLVAMTLGLTLIASVIQILVANRQTFRTTQAMSGVQETARFAMHYLTKDLRMAGFQGCGNGASVNYFNNVDKDSDNAADDISYLMDFSAVVVGSNNVTDDKAYGGYTVLAGTDTVRVQYGGSCGGQLEGSMSSDSADITISANNSCDFSVGDTLLITDCIKADVVVATTLSSAVGITTIAHANSANLSGRLSKAYSNDSETFALQSFDYFIGNSLTTGNPALIRWNNAETTGMELVEGVENMQISYGEDTDDDGTANYYVPAGTAGLNMGDVVSAKLSLLVASTEEVATMNLTYNFNGSTTVAADRKLYKVFSNTIAFRNRLK